MRGTPAEAAGQDFGCVLVEGRLGRGIIGEHGCEVVQVFEEIFVGEVAGFEVSEEGGKADCCCNRQEGGPILGGFEQIHEGGEEDASGLFFGRETE